MTNREPLLIKLAAFLCGAVVMSAEILGSRMLAPNYGSSVFVWGSLISVFLAGLSTGYYFGGRVADARASYRTLGWVILLSGLFLALLALSHKTVSEAIFNLDLDPRAGALLNSTLLFFAPSALLGAVSPCSARLLIRRLSTSGTTVGALYALSTIGSIAGTLFTSFFLISIASASVLLLCQGILLSALALPFFRIR